MGGLSRFLVDSAVAVLHHNRCYILEVGFVVDLTVHWENRLKEKFKSWGINPICDNSFGRAKTGKCREVDLYAK